MCDPFSSGSKFCCYYISIFFRKSIIKAARECNRKRNETLQHKPWKHYAKCDKLVTKDHLLHDATYILTITKTRHNQKAHFNWVSIFKLRRRCSPTILEIQSVIFQNLKHGKMTKRVCVNLRQCLLAYL